ncbi:hypothetical protein PPERSA_04262 [Pseudocohnilembus persalinus]|uniref:Transmembrane protein n=1 Tax=Pseudocohnilembus persalinus TaxID=266149 RepID=A0A0V0QNQ8_PSEPJ|nr:hypothetical protein PPERSA_04262 [Pseudocohnilembus persalinus]|eukprot:KRX03754.1 hypothetical protein PPERSA_04262 [Pseudocohnilembus persalinus]
MSNYFLKSNQPLNYQPAKKDERLPLSIDNAQILCGNGHKYQLKAIFVSSLQYLFASFLAAGWPLLFQNPTFYCYKDATQTDYEECDRRDACNLKFQGQSKDAINYFVDKDDEYFNLTEQYELYCTDNSWIYNTTQIFILGGVLGSLYFAFRMEQKGRLRYSNIYNMYDINAKNIIIILQFDLQSFE